MAIVTVDFDGTLFRGDSFQVMFKAAKEDFTWREWGVVGRGLARALVKGVFKGKQAFKNGFFRSFARSFKGKSKGELDAFFQKLIQIGKSQINWELVDFIQTHQKKGDTIIVLSGAFQPFLEAFIDEVGLDVHIISTELGFDSSGICTGEIIQLVNGPVKVDKVKQWMNVSASEKEDTSAPETWAYADSLSDVPLLEFVDYPVVVNPKNDMKEAAERRSWPIFPETEQA